MNVLHEDEQQTRSEGIQNLNITINFFLLQRNLEIWMVTDK